MTLTWLKKTLRLLASLKIAIPLLVVLTAVTVVGSLFPDPDLFWSNAYLGLLGLLGLSLLLITIQHAPLILKRKGRNAMIGVIATHLGILVVIAGIIYGGYTGFRHEIRLIEGEVTVLPALPFVIALDKLIVEEYRQEDYPRMNLAVLPRKRQESHIRLMRHGEDWRSLVVAPGSPARIDGVMLLPDLNDIGWYFELDVTDRRGRQRTIPVRPWDLPLIRVGERQIVVHGAIDGAFDEVELMALEGEQLTSLGFAGQDEGLEIDGSEFRLGKVRRYTGMQVYNRPQEPILVAGSVLMFAGLVWHFYFRHRDRRREGKRDA